MYLISCCEYKVQKISFSEGNCSTEKKLLLFCIVAFLLFWANVVVTVGVLFKPNHPHMLHNSIAAANPPEDSVCLWKNNSLNELYQSSGEARIINSPHP